MISMGKGHPKNIISYIHIVYCILGSTRDPLGTADSKLASDTANDSPILFTLSTTHKAIKKQLV